MIEKQREDMRRLRELESDGKIDFSTLPVIESHVREILLKWISDALENPAGAATTEEGRHYMLDMSRKEERCVVHLLSVKALSAVGLMICVRDFCQEVMTIW